MDVLRNGHRKQEIHEHFIEWVNPSNRANSIELTKKQLPNFGSKWTISEKSSGFL
jgi:hypothetical protein